MPASAKSSPKTKTPAPTSAPPKAASRAVKKGDHVFLVDGSGYIFRAYHAIRFEPRTPDGTHVNAVYGFCGMLWKLLMEMKPDEKPTHLAVVFDKSEQTFRTEMFKDYKAHRPPPPDDLIPQFPLIREAVRAFEIPCLEQAGYEADDLIATYARITCEAGATATIVSSDKDLMQLVNDCVIMYDTMKDVRIGVPEVIEKFGVPPEKVIEVQALIGDSTDNVPGVPGIGVKTAAQLIGEFGDLETLLARAGEIKQEKRRQALIEHAEKARLSKKLVTLDAHVKLEVTLAELAVHDPDHKRLIAFLKAMEFSTLTRRVAEFAGIDPGAIEPDEKLQARGAPRQAKPAEQASLPFVSAKAGPVGKPAEPAVRKPGDAQPEFTPQARAAARIAAARNVKIDRSRYEILRDLEPLAAWISRARELGTFAIAIEVMSIDPMQANLCGFSLALAANEACYVPLAHRKRGDGGNASLFAGEIAPGQIEERAALAALKPLLEDPGVLKVGQDIKFDLQMFALRGIEVAPYDDVMLMSYVLDAGRAGHALAALSQRYFDHTTIDYNQLTGSGKSKVTFDCVAVEKAAEYAAEDADVTLRLWQLLKPRLTSER